MLNSTALLAGLANDCIMKFPHDLAASDDKPAEFWTPKARPSGACNSVAMASP